MPEDAISHMIKDFIVHLGAAGRATSTIACYQRDLEHLAKDVCALMDTIISRHVKNETNINGSVRLGNAPYDFNNKS